MIIFIVFDDIKKAMQDFFKCYLNDQQTKEKDNQLFSLKCCISLSSSVMFFNLEWMWYKIG